MPNSLAERGKQHALRIPLATCLEFPKALSWARGVGGLGGWGAGGLEGWKGEEQKKQGEKELFGLPSISPPPSQDPMWVKSTIVTNQSCSAFYPGMGVEWHGGPRTSSEMKVGVLIIDVGNFVSPLTHPMTCVG